jgi:hypothetical protein
MTLLNDLQNATLTLVTGVGFSGDYDRDPTPGTTKFSGEERVFWKESVARVSLEGVASDLIVDRSMLVDPSIGVTWAEGDTVTVARDGEVTQTAKVQKFTTSGTEEVGRVTRVIFEDA